jgi:antirestriction protein
MEQNVTTQVASDTQRKPRPPRIYVASLADYNAGDLLGCWIDADQPVDVIHEQVGAMLATSTQPVAEEWAIHDYEGFGVLGLSEYEDLDHVAGVARGIVEFGEVFAAVVAHFGGTGNVEEARRYMEEGYRGDFDTVADYAETLIEDCYHDVLKGLPDFIRYHIDFGGIGQDMELSGDIFTIATGGRLHIFDAHV